MAILFNLVLGEIHTIMRWCRLTLPLEKCYERVVIKGLCKVKKNPNIPKQLDRAQIPIQIFFQMILSLYQTSFNNLNSIGLF